jgi:hypothetical protein
MAEKPTAAFVLILITGLIVDTEFTVYIREAQCQ